MGESVRPKYTAAAAVKEIRGKDAPCYLLFAIESATYIGPTRILFLDLCEETWLMQEYTGNQLLSTC